MSAASRAGASVVAVWPWPSISLMRAPRMAAQARRVARVSSSGLVVPLSSAVGAVTDANWPGS
jgi:hypothetical protein